MSKQDDVNILYRQSKVLSDIASGLYIGNCFVLFLDYSFPSLSDFWLWPQLLFVLLFLGVTCINDCQCRYEADKERRSTNIENAFALDITEYKTEGYYNNSVPPSLAKYVVNTFESAYFTKNVVAKMLVAECIKAVVGGIVLLLSLRLADNNLLLLILEIVTSVYLLQGAIMTILFYFKVKEIYLKFYQLLITEKLICREQSKRYNVVL